ncbi:hypothetical protein AB0O18_35120 [Streptomyces sp. NPDC093224]|uniref:hypothetical protein n=1 Tax=Streptomyces sp. NPDC093224 TaxID=3155198 RepID=UPI00341BB9AF
MTLRKGQRVRLAADLRLTGAVVVAADGPAGEEPDSVVGSLSLAAGTEGTVERVHGPREHEQSHEVREYVRLTSLRDDFGHQMPPASRQQLEERIGELEPHWLAHREQRAHVTARVRLDNGFVLDDAHEAVLTPA